MARPIRNNAEYFTHPANFRNDRRVKAVRARFGMAGYGLLLMLMEALTDAEYTHLSTDELEMELLAGDFGVSVTEIDSLLQLCQKIGLLSRNADGNLICEDLNNSLRQVFDKRNRSRDLEEQRKKTVSVTETPVSVEEIPQSKVKRSKENKKDSADKSAEPTLTHKLRLAVEELVPEYYWGPKDGKHALELIEKLKNSYRVTRKVEPTDEQLVESLKTLIAKTQSLSPYHRFNNVASLNEKFNATVAEIRNPVHSGINGKVTTNHTPKAAGVAFNELT